MPFDETNAMSELAGAPGGQSPGGAPPAMAGPGPGAGVGGPQPGNKVDTPAEQKAVQLLMQGAIMWREAAKIDPTVAYIVDSILQKSFMDISKHYGMEQEGKLAMQQAQLQKQRNMQSRFNSPQPTPPGPPTGGAGPMA